MKIFKEKAKTNVSSIIDTGSILYPKREEIDNYRQKKLEHYMITTLYNLVDYNDYSEFCNKLATSFYEDNLNFINNLKNLGSENIENIWDTLNRFMSLNNLGYSQIEISISSKKIIIYHYESPFVDYLYRFSNTKVCSFLSSFYSHTLSSIFETNIRMKEVECKNEKNRDFCIFEML